PQCLLVMPPVEVPAARLPCASSATAPTVPSASRAYSQSFSAALCSASAAFSFCNCCQRSSVRKYAGSTNGMPCSTANASAPSRASSTCLDSSITSLASWIGFLMRVTPATAPACKVAPFMIEASSSFLPSAVNTAPLPALNNGEFSSTAIAAATASTLLPPCCNTL